MKVLKFFTAFGILLIALSCNKISETVEVKVKEEIDSQVDEKLKQIDSSMSKGKLDSLKSQIDSVMGKTNLDSLMESIDSTINKDK